MSDAGRWPDRVEVVDSHTEGEPTRVVVEGWPQPAGAHDGRAARVPAPPARTACARRSSASRAGTTRSSARSSRRPVEPGSAAGVVFFNNAGALGMCGHGLIGVVRTLELLGRLAPGPAADRHAGRHGRRGARGGRRGHDRERAGLLPRARRRGGGAGARAASRGDVAWGGNWFFLTELPGLPLDLANVARPHRRDVAHPRGPPRAGRSRAGTAAEIDHVELFGPPRRPDADSRNFVLCPGLAYDRSPCGTGTSAKMAVLAARGKLAPGPALAAGEHHRLALRGLARGDAAARSCPACAAARS